MLFGLNLVFLLDFQPIPLDLMLLPRFVLMCFDGQLCFLFKLRCSIFDFFQPMSFDFDLIDSLLTFESFASIKYFFLLFRL